MAKLSDLYSDDEWERLQAESDALSEEERRAKIQEAFAGLKNASWNQPIDFSAFRNIDAPVFDVDDLPEIESPFPKMLDVMVAMQGETERANRSSGRFAKSALVIAVLALLTNLLPVQDWIARLW